MIDDVKLATIFNVIYPYIASDGKSMDFFKSSSYGQTVLFNKKSQEPLKLNARQQTRETPNLKQFNFNAEFLMNVLAFGWQQFLVL